MDMVILLREIADTCFGLKGNFSVLRDLFGYRGNSAPGTTLLTPELKQVRENEHVTIHIKLVSTPNWTLTSTISVDEMIFSMRQVYNNAGIAVIVASSEDLILAHTDILVDECVTGEVTDDQTELFNNRNNVGQNEIVIYLVRSVFTTDPMLPGGLGEANGCATFPAGRPGAVVSGPIATRWTLAHEIGHVLNNSHIESGVCPVCQTPPTTVGCDLTNIMTCCGTGLIPAGTLPVFSTDQIQRIIDSNLTRRCAD